MLNKNFEEIKNVKEYLQELEENLTGVKEKHSKEIEVDYLLDDEGLVRRQDARAELEYEDYRQFE